MKYEKILQPSFHWKRGLGWEFIDVVMYKKNVADVFSHAGLMYPALTTYLDILQLLSSPFVKMAAIDDQSLHMRCLRIHSVTITNICLLFQETEESLPPALPEILREHLVRLSEAHLPDHIFEMPYVSRGKAKAAAQDGRYFGRDTNGHRYGHFRHVG